MSSNLVAIKGGHAVGKTQALGAIVPWFLCSYTPSIVLTTAPSEEQVKGQIWQEVRLQISHANRPLPGLPGGMRPSDPYWQVGFKHYAKGIATNKETRFRGDHSPNMLIILDEGPGVPEWALTEARNMCTAPNNKIVMIGNPTVPQGHYFEAFGPKSPWTTVTLSCLDHPNVRTGKNLIPGATSRQWVESYIESNCERIDPKTEQIQEHDFEFPEGSGEWYRPDDIFLCRVMGEFPSEGPDSLFPLWCLELGRRTVFPIDTTTPVDIGVDIADKGKDATVVICRRGRSVIKRLKWSGQDTERTKREIGALCRQYVRDGIRVGTVAIDATGIGTNVAEGLIYALDEGEIHADAVLAVQVAEKATRNDMYSTKRDEICWALSDRCQQGNIEWSRLGDDARDFEHQALNIEREYDSKFRFKMPSKDKLRPKIGCSPDDFDAMTLAFIDTADNYADNYAAVMTG